MPKQKNYCILFAFQCSNVYVERKIATLVHEFPYVNATNCLVKSNPYSSQIAKSMSTSQGKNYLKAAIRIKSLVSKGDSF